MKIANGRSDIERISFVRESTVLNKIADNTVPSLSDKEGVTTKVSEMTKRNEVKFFFRSAAQPNG